MLLQQETMQLGVLFVEGACHGSNSGKCPIGNNVFVQEGLTLSEKVHLSQNVVIL